LKLHFFGAAGHVAGSCFMLETGKRKILIDCGMFQGSKALRERNYGEFPFNPSEIDFLILTHAHIDHSGLIPKLVKKGFEGRIYCSTATKELCSLLLPDSGYIQVMEVERKNRKLKRAGQPLLTPIYTPDDAEMAMAQFSAVRRKEIVTIDSEIKFRLNEAGHILGATIVELWVGDIKIVFTGDLGNKDQPIIKDPDYIEEADYLVIESTYGSRNHTFIGDNEKKLTEIIKETFARGGNLIIPSFAVARTQDLLYHLHNIKNSNEFKELNIYVDSPLAINATKVFCERKEYYDQETKDLEEACESSALVFEGVKFTPSVEESMALNTIEKEAIIISASGMAEAGRIKHHLKHNLWREESTILFVGYQAQGTLGRRIVDGEKIVRIHGEEIMVKANIISLDGFSSHADQKGLLEWVGNIKKPPKQVFVVHGEKESSQELAKAISEKFNIKTTVPSIGEVFELKDSDSIQLVSPPDSSEEHIRILYGQIIKCLDTKVNVGLAKKNNEELLEKLARIMDYVQKI
jgi:metallo-beta-lactamase family protein